ncbi:MAG: CAP domain-containing protein [Hyphomicrobiaceae bacterium]|nr:CAP domain-containing protein [Hyphomicrobiaceae bacterium]MCC0023785.1 CAP domain-containing protein [Hyphomicrobiaceae bacterium]
MRLPEFLANAAKWLGLVLLLGLAACSASSLPAGLSQRLDSPGAQLDRAEALRLVNQFRASRGAPPLVEDPTLNQQAQTLASQYAATNNQPARPNGVGAMHLSAGYANFAETFSGWRSDDNVTRSLANPAFTRIGLAASFAASSTYGVHWVMLLAEPIAAPAVAAQ